MHDELTDADRFPLLTEAGVRTLRRLREHPHAPRFNFTCGERLSAAGLENVRRFAAGMRPDAVAHPEGGLPEWLPGFVEFCRRDVPLYRREAWRAGGGDDFSSLPLLSRDTIRREPWAFVPDSQPLDDLIVYYTSGTAGDRMYMPSHPETAARYLPLLAAALAANGVALPGGADRVAVARVSSQRRTFTYPSVVSYLDSAGFVKVNLNPADWRAADDPARFFDDCRPDVFTSDPVALADLARCPFDAKPRAVVSSGTALLPGMKRSLEARFACPVVDLYSLCEFGPVACTRPGVEGHEVLPWELFVEVVDDAGRPCPPGVRGEVVLTGRLNPFLPLLRYRTGDHAALAPRRPGEPPRLLGLEGRATVAFRGANGLTLHGIDVTGALRDLPLPFLSLRQHADGSMRLRTRCDDDTSERVDLALRDLFGPGQVLEIERVPEELVWQGKPLQYTSEMEPA